MPRPVVVLPAAGGHDLDPVGELRQLAADALADYRANPGNAGLVREARLTLQALIGLPGAGDEDDPLAELRSLMGPS